MRSVDDPGHCSLWERAGEAQQLLSVALDYASLLSALCRGKVIRKAAPRVLSTRVSVPLLFDDLATDRQPQARALRFRRKEWLEQAISHVRRDPGPSSCTVMLSHVSSR